MHKVRCSNRKCPAEVVISTDGVDIHDALDAAGCTCCPVPHNHGQANRETGVACRPVTIIPMDIELVGTSAETF
jgi:hypothetical protein